MLQPPRRQRNRRDSVLPSEDQFSQIPDTDFAIRAFRIYLCMMIFACVNKACFIFLQAMGKAVSSTVLSMVHEIVFGVGFALLLPLFYGLDGVLYSMPLSDILTFVIAVFLIVGTYKELNREVEKYA